MNLNPFALLAFLLLPCGPPLLASPPPQACVEGEWEAPFNHDFSNPFPSFPNMTEFNAIHLCLIPTPSGITGENDRGKVLVWDSEIGNQDETLEWLQRWSILDPADGSCINKELILPVPGAGVGGDLFCAGHSWGPDGRLFVAGGTSQYEDLSAGLSWKGAKLSYLFEPDKPRDDRWVRQDDMATDRWYPSVVWEDEQPSQQNDRILALGGTADTSLPPLNDYEAFEYRTTPVPHAVIEDLHDGPGDWGHSCYPNPFPSILGIYPRVHRLAAGTLLRSGFSRYGATLDHTWTGSAWQGDWTQIAESWVGRVYGTAALFPVILGNGGTVLQEDLVYVLGGSGRSDCGVDLGLLSSVEFLDWNAPGGPEWTFARSMARARKWLNCVLLPDETLLVVGGPIGMLIPELYDPATDQWTDMAAAASTRNDHSTLIVLPDARVLSAGGNDRQYDYQIFKPPYLCGTNPRPVITPPASEEVDYGGTYPLSWTGLADVEKVVLLRPGAVTHHSDHDQRLVRLEAVVNNVAKTVAVTMPTNRHHAPPGYSMAFMISDLGVPSEAVWVLLD